MATRERSIPTSIEPPEAEVVPEPVTDPSAEPEPEVEVTPEPRLLDPVSRFVDAGVRLDYLEWTPQRPIATPPVVLLYGISGNAHNYDALTAAIAERFHLYALDLRGHGDSAWDAGRDYRISALVYDLNLFIDQLGLNQVILVGTGLGAGVPLGLVSARPASCAVSSSTTRDPKPAARSEASPGSDPGGAGRLRRRRRCDVVVALALPVTRGVRRRCRGGVHRFDAAELRRRATRLEVRSRLARGRGPGGATRRRSLDRRRPDQLAYARRSRRIQRRTGRPAARRLRGRVRGAAFVEAKGVAHALSLVEEDVLPALESFLRSIGQEGPVAAV